MRDGDHSHRGSARSHLNKEQKSSIEGFVVTIGEIVWWRPFHWLQFTISTEILGTPCLCAGPAYKKTARWIPAPFWIVEVGRVFYRKHRRSVWTSPSMQTVFLPSA